MIYRSTLCQTVGHKKWTSYPVLDYRNRIKKTMRKLNKIKLHDLVDQASEINVEEMQKITGGDNTQDMSEDGCYSGICSQKINTSYCDGGAVCTSGIAG